jgi:hypothetical protein
MKHGLIISFAIAAISCSMARSPMAGSETHFLRECSADCAAPYTCLCGVCSLACEDSQVCGQQTPAATCLAPAAQSCDDAPHMCDLTCRVATDCSALGSGARCSAGRCRTGGSLVDGGAPRDGSVADASMRDAAQVDGAAPDASGGVVDAGLPVDSSVPVTSTLCDGSSDIRLSIATSGGFVASTYTFTSPRGAAFSTVDGKCHYYASTDYMVGISEGDLTATEATQLLSDIGWSNRLVFRGESPANCADGGTTVVTTPDSAFACTCGDCGSAASAGKTAAISSAAKVAMTYAPRGKRLGGPVSAIAYVETFSNGSQPQAWPLSRSMLSVDGLVQASNAATLGSGARFDAVADASALRTVRAAARTPTNSYAGFALVDDGGIYSLYVRDELPADVSQSYDAFVANGQKWLTIP